MICIDGECKYKHSNDHVVIAYTVVFGKWTDHVKSWQNPELADRILYITYEEMLQVK